MNRHIRQGAAVTIAAVVGHQHQRSAARGKLRRQGFRREHVTTGATGRQQDWPGGHDATPLPSIQRVSAVVARRLVKARTMPMPKARAKIDDPP